MLKRSQIQGAQILIGSSPENQHGGPVGNPNTRVPESTCRRTTWPPSSAAMNGISSSPGYLAGPGRPRRSASDARPADLSRAITATRNASALARSKLWIAVSFASPVVGECVLFHSAASLAATAQWYRHRPSAGTWSAHGAVGFRCGGPAGAADPAGGSGQILSDPSNEDVRIRRRIGFWC